MTRKRAPRATREPRTTPSPSARTQSTLERARIEAQAELILAQLELRFETLPPRIVRRVRSGTPKDMKRWATRMLILPTPEDVVAIDRSPEPWGHALSVYLAANANIPETLREQLAGLVDSIRERGSVPGDWIRGEAYGIESARLEGEANLLLHLLAHRFRRVPKRIEHRIEQSVVNEDAASLYAWAERLLTADTVAEVFADEDDAE